MKAEPMSAESKAEHEKWEAESDVRTLTEAERIRADKPRHRRAVKMAREQMKALGTVGGDDA